MKEESNLPKQETLARLLLNLTVKDVQDGLDNFGEKYGAVWRANLCDTIFKEHHKEEAA